MRKKFKRIWKKRKKMIIGTLIVLIILGVIIKVAGAQKNEDFEEIEVQRGNIQETIETNGTIQPVKHKDLFFIPSGIVEKIEVEEGQEVAEGQIIAQLDTTVLEAQIKNSQGQVRSVSSTLSRSQDPKLIDLQEEKLALSGIDLDQARHDYESSQELNDATLDQAGLAYESATIAEDNLETTYSNTKKETDQAIEVSEEYEETVPPGSEDWAEEQTEMTEISQDSQLDSLEGQIELQEIQTEQAALEYEMAKIRAEDSTELSQTMLEKAEKAYKMEELQLEQLKSGLYYDGGTYGGQLDQAQASLEIAQYNLDNAQIIAPFTGTIIDIPFKEGDIYMGGEMGARPVRLVDMDKFKVEAEVNELDIVDMYVGQKAIVEFDGLPDESFEGEVTKISLNPLVKDGVVIYIVDVTFERPDNVYLGMTANVEFVIKEEENALYIPISAFDIEDGKYYVQVKTEENKIERRKIEIGIQSDTDAQILEGLKEGDIVVY
ncbi:efflux RND transporter periplasmic adaptor subunit [Candidatus Dojkabacteria bacterium]|nr:efflux RND transporter periplasmic adaptor subunit [Candidatus Dojkabacteria bacterium]